MFRDLVNAAYRANSEAELQKIILQISNEAVVHGLTFEDKLKIPSLVLKLSAKYHNFAKNSASIMQIIMECKTISGKSTSILKMI